MYVIYIAKDNKEKVQKIKKNWGIIYWKRYILAGDGKIVNNYTKRQKTSININIQGFF